MTIVELDRAQSEAAAQIIGLRFRNRRTGRVQQVTDVVRMHKPGAKVVKVAENGREIHAGECIRVVLDDKVRVSWTAFAEGWTSGKSSNKTDA